MAAIGAGLNIGQRAETMWGLKVFIWMRMSTQKSQTSPDERLDSKPLLLAVRVTFVASYPRTGKPGPCTSFDVLQVQRCRFG